MHKFPIILTLFCLMSCQSQVVSQTSDLESTSSPTEQTEPIEPTETTNNEASTKSEEPIPPTENMLVPDEEEGTIVTLQLAHYQVPCFGEGEVILCHLAQEGEEILEENWEYFYEAIKGFENYELGYNYQLKVRKTEVASPIPEDASSIAYSLVELVEKTKAVDEATFELFIKDDAFTPAYLTKDAVNDGYLFANSLNVKLDESIVEKDLVALLEGETTFSGVFQHNQESSGLILIQIQQEE